MAVHRFRGIKLTDQGIPVAAVAAGRTLNSAPADADLILTAKTKGVLGNTITIALVNSGVTATLLVSVVDTAITVRLATTDAVITSIASAVKAAIDALPAAAALVAVALEAVGAGLVEAFAAQPLVGGIDATAAAKGTLRFGVANAYLAVADVTITDDLTNWKKLTLGVV